MLRFDARPDAPSSLGLERDARVHVPPCLVLVTPGCNRARRGEVSNGVRPCSDASRPRERPGAGVGLSGAVTPPATLVGGPQVTTTCTRIGFPLGGNDAVDPAGAGVSAERAGTRSHAFRRRRMPAPFPHASPDGTGDHSETPVPRMGRASCPGQAADAWSVGMLTLRARRRERESRTGCFDDLATRRGCGSAQPRNGPRDHQVERRVARPGRARLEDQAGAAASLDDSSVRRGVDRPHPEGDASRAATGSRTVMRT